MEEKGQLEDPREEFWKREFHRSNAEEWANAMSHFAGFVFGIFALTFMCVYAAQEGEVRKIVGNAIFGTTLVFLYNCSTLYHLIWKHKVKSVFQFLDHISIYLLIAGTYTPYTLWAMREHPVAGWTVFCTTWLLAAIGILVECLLKPRREWLVVTIYLVMGWQVILVIDKVIAGLNTLGVVMLVVGGGVYTTGVIFYAFDNVPYMHTVWHGFVLAGSICHWVSVTFG